MYSKTVLEVKGAIKLGAASVLILALLAPVARAGEIDDARKDLAVVRAVLAEEFQRRNAAKAEMERSLMFIETRLPLLLKREKELLEKLEKLEKK